MTKKISVSINDNIYNQIKELTVIKNIDINTIMSDALISYLHNCQKTNTAGEGLFDFIDLFAGIGGMRLGFEQAGCRCVFSSEWNENCKKTYYANFNEIPLGDITKINAKDVPNHDILVAGFPCQPFSIAGVSKKNSLGRETGFKDKTQGTLFFDVCRIMAEKRPKAFLLENVKNLRSHDKGNTWKVINECLNDLNYSVFSGIFDGKDFVPQHRERVIIVGFDKERYGDVDFSFNYTTPIQQIKLIDILESEYDDKYILSDKLWTYLQDYAIKHKQKGNGFGYGMPDLYGITRTLSARYYKDGSEILISRGEGNNPRRLTPRECARLQGFPDDYNIIVGDMQAYKQFGNSVVVPLISAIAKLIVEKLLKLSDIDNRPISNPAYLRNEG